MPGDAWQQFANLRAYFGYMFGHPGKKLLFMRCEFGQWRESDAESSLGWHLPKHRDHNGLLALNRDLNALYELDAETEGFDWIDFSDHDQSVIAFQRSDRTPSEEILFVSNLIAVLREGYSLGVPTPGRYVERLNADADLYAEGNHGNLGEVHASPVESHGRPNSIEISLPPSRRSCSSTSRDPRILPGYKSPRCLDDRSHNGDVSEPIARARPFLPQDP